jgi:hypothetical protein
MIYIFFNNKTQNYKPEINYGNGHNLAFKKGWFLFDEEKQSGKVSFWKVDGANMQIDGDPYQIKPEYTFKHPIKAEIAFLRLKLVEMKASSFDFFMPTTYNKIQNRFNELRENHPEYVL